MTSFLSLDWFLLLLLLTLSQSLLISANNNNLTFMLVTSWGGFGYNSSGTLPSAAEIALRSINSRPDLLPGYSLVYNEVRDSKVSSYYNY